MIDAPATALSGRAGRAQSLAGGARRGVAIAALFAAISWTSAGCDRVSSGSEPARDAAPRRQPAASVLLLSMDTTRADHFGCYGHADRATPNIDRLARAGALFEHCVAPAPLTLPSHATLLTGVDPYVHGARDNGIFKLHDDNRTLAEALREAGFQTSACVAVSVLDESSGVLQGFETLRDVPRVARDRGLGIAGRLPADVVAEEALARMRQAPARFFLFVHFFDPHDPYEPPAEYRAAHDDPYLAEIAFVDAQIGRLLAELDALGRADETLVVLSADHGEGRGDHEELTHGSFLYDSTLRVPLILRLPGRLPAGARVAGQARTKDIAPTILALLDQPALPGAQGEDLAPLIDGTEAPGRAAYSETFAPRFAMGFSHLRSLSAEGWKYIHGPRPELYHVADDPAERADLAASEPQRAAEMRDALRRMLAGTPRVADGAAQPLSPEERRRLESLGYVHAGGADFEDVSELERFEPRGANPMDHVRELRLKEEALPLIARRDYAGLEAKMRALIETAGPHGAGLAWPQAQLGQAIFYQGRFAESLAPLEKSVAANPRDPETLTLLGMAQAQLGRGDAARETFERALACGTELAATRRNLGLLLLASGAPREAVPHLRRAIEIDPRTAGDPTAHAQLARALAAAGERAGAESAIDEAIRLAQSSNAAALVARFRALREQIRQGAPAP